jgi:hypothetical protein
MKKITTLIFLLTNFIGNAQCPAPSNLNVYGNTIETYLSWTENGTATVWEVAIIPNYNIGDPIPISGTITSSNPHIFINLPPTCNAFFVRSICSATDISPWSVIGSGCSLNVHNYLVTLSNDNFLPNSNGFEIFPNPSKNIVQIKCISTIDKITVFDSLGKAILIQTQGNDKINVENISKGIYVIEIFTQNKKIYRKFIKE